MPISDAQRARFREEMDRVGVDSKKAASVKARWKSGPKAGKPLSDSYISQALNKGRGSYQGMELICEATGGDWPYVKDGKRTPPFIKGQGPRSVTSPPLDFDALRDLIASALGIAGMSPQDAASLAKSVVKTWRDRQSLD